MNGHSELLGPLVGGISIFITGMGIVQGVELFGISPAVGVVGLLIAAGGVAETFDGIIRWLRRGMTATADLMEHPRSQRFIHTRTIRSCIGLLFLSSPVYFYTFELQFIPREQWISQIITLDPVVYLIYMIGGPLFTGFFVGMRHFASIYYTERIKPRMI